MAEESATSGKPPVKKVPPKAEFVSQYPPPEGVTRRSFLMSWAGLAWMTFSVSSAVGGLASVKFFLGGQRWGELQEPVLKFPVGKLEDFSLGVDERFKQSRGVWLIRTEKTVFALITVCTHLGCTPNWLMNENKFKCPCHGSGFRMNGVNFEGPAPRPLERAKIYKDPTSGLIIVDKSKKFLYEKGEWDDKESYIDLTSA